MGFYVYFKGRPTDIPSRFFFLIIVHWFKMLFSAVQQSDSVMHVFFFFNFLFHYGLSQDIECSSLCHTVRPYCLSILYIIICTC